VGAAAGVLAKGRVWGGVLAGRIGPIARPLAERVLDIRNKQMVGMDRAPGGIPYQGEIPQECLAWTWLRAPGSSGRGTVLDLAKAGIEPAGFCQMASP
jgi:hypothetical protein